MYDLYEDIERSYESAPIPVNEDFDEGGDYPW
jgi:hypothetical protein